MGIYDLINLDMIPKINVYRGDLITSDIDPTQWPKPSVEAILISYAHLDARAGKKSVLYHTGKCLCLFHPSLDTRQ
jgi:ribonuclease J